MLKILFNHVIIIIIKMYTKSKVDLITNEIDILNSRQLSRVLIVASLSEPHHVGSTVKSVFLLPCLKPYRIWLKTV